MIFVKWFCGWIWWIAETFNLPLGRAAPYILGGILGRMPKKVKKK